jgi:ubiquinone/menaquinone biosynthesis C-methylase UbiE
MLLLNYCNLIDPILRPLRRALPDFAGLSPHQSILDVCCGTGAQAFEYARRGLSATGIDLDPNMINLAARYVKRAHGLSLTLQTADAADLPFPDASFDAASICLALHEKDSTLQDKVLPEMRRVVKRGGKLIFVDYAIPLPAGWRQVIGTIERLAGKEHSACFGQYSAAGGLDAILRRHDLKVVREDKSTAGNIRLCLTMNVT